MAPFNPFPVNYTPYGYQQYQPQQYQPAPQMQQPGQMQEQQQTKYVEAIPVDTEQEVTNCPMSAGSTGFFFARNDSFNAVKSVSLNGQVTVTFFDKRPPAPAAPPFNPGDYVTKEELESRLAAILAPKRATKKEPETDGS